MGNLDGGRARFGDAVGVVGLEAFEALAGSGTRPLDLDCHNTRGVADPDLLSQWIRAEAGPGAERAMDGAGTGGRFEEDVDAGSDGGAIGANTFKVQPKPAVGGTGILEQAVVGVVAGEGATHDHVDILVAVVVEVGEGHAMALLQVAGAGGGADVLEMGAAVVSVHPVGDERGEVGVSGGEVEVEPSIVVEIAEVAAHGVADPVEPGHG